MSRKGWQIYSEEGPVKGTEVDGPYLFHEKLCDIRTRVSRIVLNSNQINRRKEEFQEIRCGRGVTYGRLIIHGPSLVNTTYNYL